MNACLRQRADACSSTPHSLVLSSTVPCTLLGGFHIDVMVRRNISKVVFDELGCEIHGDLHAVLGGVVEVADGR